MAQQYRAYEVKEKRHKVKTGRRRIIFGMWYMLKNVAYRQLNERVTEAADRTERREVK